MASVAERRVLDAARLVLLGWLGDSVDGGRAMREALVRLREALEIYDAQVEQRGPAPILLPGQTVAGPPFPDPFRKK